MSDVKAVRDLLARIDGHRKFADEAEHARGRIRLSEKPVARQGLLWFIRRQPTHRDLGFTQAETNAIYVALGKVRDEERRRAAELEQTIGGVA